MNVKILMSVILMLASGYADFVSAHSQSGAIGRKLSKAGGTDQYSITCFDDGTGVPDHLYVHVRDLRPLNPAQISIQGKTPDGVASGISTDAKDGDGNFSPALILSGGVGPYIISITKTRSRMKGREVYLAEFHCQTAGTSETGGSAHTGTNDPEMTQNQ
jgi:hypothetical protein